MELLLLRHAKSRWDEAALADHDRGLAPRGKKAARAMAELILDQGLLPDLVLSSTAERTTKTAALLLKRWPSAPPVHALRTLYLAPPSRILEILRRQPPTVERLLVVGHNPGLHGCACRLAGRGQSADRARLAEAFPTAALARIALPGPSWRAIDWGQGELLGYWRPRELD